ncbi:zinc finger, CCHC-type containing protein [Tanacetum coccineum]
MSTSTHPIIVPYDYDVEDVFSSTHSPDYTLASPDYFSASLGNTSPDSSDDLTKGHILNGMSDPLFDIYQNVESAKELWDSFKSKYMAEDTSSKKFLVSNFNNYKMVNSRPVMEQFNELLRILGQYTQHGLKMDESISVSNVIDKLPPSWKDFKHTLKHGKDNLSLVQLGSYLRIEESLREQDSDKGKGKEVVGPSVNMTKEGGKNKNNKQNKGKKCGFNENNGGSGSNKKPNWNVGRKASKANPKTKVDAIAWWIDSGAITHVCKDRCWFKTYEPMEDGYVLYMGDDHFAPVHGKENNLISGPVLNKCGYKKVYESDKYILSKCSVFVRFGYYNNEVELKQNDLDKTLRTNKGGEYYDPVFFQSVRIIHETTAPYTPQQNGVAERKNRALKEMVNSMAVVRLPDLKQKTLGEKGIDCIFVGYVEHSKAYRFYVIEPNDSVSVNSIIESRDAIFDENHFSLIPRPKNIIPNSDESQRDDHSDDVPSEISETRKGKRV